MANLNHFAISAALGSTIGPGVSARAGQLATPQMTSTLLSLQHRRRHIWDDEKAVQSASKQYFARVKAAFLAVREQDSVERVIVDDALNRRFIESCRRDFGIEDSRFRLNLALMTLRKRGELRGLNSERRKHVGEQWRYAYASEIAAQTMFYRHGVTVDTLICHPGLIQQFDALAEALAPGFTAFEYRWTALNIRKKGTGAVVETNSHNDPVRSLDWSTPIPFTRAQEAPDDEGVYVLREDGINLFVGSSEDIQASLVAGQQIAQPALFGLELWEPNAEQMSWQYAEMIGSESEERYSIVRRLVGTFRPVFNVPRGGREAA